MKRTILTALLAFAFGIGISLLTATPSMAVHKGSGDLTCGSCHTMHSSQGGTSSTAMGANTGSFILLRGPISSRAEIHNFCLSCHAENGAQGGTQFNSGNATTTPPKVYLNTAWANNGDGSANFATVGAGGDFHAIDSGGTPFNGTTWSGGTYDPNSASTYDALGKGHSLGRTTVVPPGNTTDGTSNSGNSIAVLTCTSCHDPHGTNVTVAGINKYRNLKGLGYIPAGAQNPVDWTTFGDLAVSPYGGVNGGNNSQGTSITTASNIWPMYRSSGTQNYYLSDSAAVSQLSNVVVGVSRFCAQCHGAWHEVTAGVSVDYNASTVAANGSDQDWKRHPTQRLIKDTGSETSGAGVTITDIAHYSDNAIIPVGSKLPVAQNCGGNGSAACDGTHNTYYSNSDGTGRVFCLSCHFPHGSPNFDILRWDYTSAVSAGSQVGKAIPSNVGCQQCHNR